MSATSFDPRAFLKPRHWPTWLGLGILRLLVLLPYSWQLRLARGLGAALYHLVPSRRHVAQTNIGLCFPGLSEREQEQRVRESYFSAAMAIFEMGLSWWGGAERMRKLHRIEGLEHLQAAFAAGRGAIMLGGHYTTLEISGRFLAFHCDQVRPIYKPAHNPLYEAVMTTSRRRLFDALLDNSDMRGILKSLKDNKVIWYAPDQDFGRERSVFAPFFDVPTATLTTTSRLARLAKAPVLPFYSERLPGNEGYLIRILPPLENFPSDDDVQDATRVNQVIEAQVSRTPGQYLWLHKRFKTRPEGEPSLYGVRR